MSNFIELFKEMDINNVLFDCIKYCDNSYIRRL